MVSALGGRCDEALVLDGACSEQRRPVGAARHFREGRGQHDEVGLGKAAEEFGKAQVEAEREADGEGLAVPGRHPEGDGGLAGFDVDALVVELGEEGVHLGGGLALERREHETAHGRLVLRQAQLVGGRPQKDAEDDSLLQHLATQKVADQQHGRVARDAGAVEVEHGKARLAFRRALHLR